MDPEANRAPRGGSSSVCGDLAGVSEGGRLKSSTDHIEECGQELERCQLPSPGSAEVPVSKVPNR